MHRIARPDFARFAIVDMMYRQSGTQSTSGVARGRLDPQIGKLLGAQHLAVSDAIQRDAACEAQILIPVSLAAEAVSFKTTLSVTA